MQLRPHTQRSPSAGFTVVKVMVAAAVLIIGLLGIISSVISGIRLVNANHEMSLAHQAARAARPTPPCASSPGERFRPIRRPGRARSAARRAKSPQVVPSHSG